MGHRAPSLSNRKTRIDYTRIFQILRGAGFAGWLSIVYEGTTLAEDGRNREPIPVKAALAIAVTRLRQGIEESAQQAKL